jgi:N6-L-threonylcarbamoyladenine synthase
MATKNIKIIRILGIDTSCDETAISILEIKNSKTESRKSGTKVKMRTGSSSPFKILANIVSSQVKLHAKYGGVYPSLAKREHIKNLPFVLKRAVKGIKVSEIDFVAVTVGPGLEPCLWQGINFAKDLVKNLKKPLISINHIEAHILANFLNYQLPTINCFPAVCLVVSGGHTQLILMKDIGKYQLIGETRDDAAGECFDKTARILGLGYPGGPAIAAEATKNIGGLSSVKLPRPMMHTKDYDFSFSGLKTAVLYEFQSRSPKVKKSPQYIQAMCFEIQQAIIDVLLKKTLKATKDFRAKSIILGGGVAANTELRRQFKEKIKKEIPDSKFYIPDSKYCTDNAVMIAVAAYFNQKKASRSWKNIKADGNLKMR